jgi:hypothetical protein
MWQDMIFLAGSVFSLLVLAPTLRDSMANVPLGTSLPSAMIGIIYGTAFLTLGMTLSATGAFLTGVIWSLIAALRSPHPFNDRPSPTTNAEATQRSVAPTPTNHHRIRTEDSSITVSSGPNDFCTGRTFGEGGRTFLSLVPIRTNPTGIGASQNGQVPRLEHCMVMDWSGVCNRNCPERVWSV